MPSRETITLHGPHFPCCEPLFREQQNEETSGRVVTTLNVPPRRMWGWGPGLKGYCGEASFQSCGLFYGNYFSQERIRYAAGNKELLVGLHDEKVAKALKLKYQQFDESQKGVSETETFLRWAQRHVTVGHNPVISGFFLHVPTKSDGHEGYDHIMVTVGFGGVTHAFVIF